MQYRYEYQVFWHRLEDVQDRLNELGKQGYQLLRFEPDALHDGDIETGYFIMEREVEVSAWGPEVSAQ